MNADARLAPSVEGELNYLASGSPRPVTYTYEPPPGIPRSNVVVDPRRVVIRNVRAAAHPQGFTLDKCGFELIQSASAVTDFSDEAGIRSVYYAEVERLLLRATGASRVLVFDHTLRDSGQEVDRATVREPVLRVHNDQTLRSGPRRVLDHLPADEALELLRHRFAIINVWRPIGAPVEQFPLAFCDARTIAAEDRVPGDLVYRDKIGEVYSFSYNPVHCWYYVSHLRPDEAILLKIYDSLNDGTARLTAHSAFIDPTAPTDARPRRSIELRTLVFY